MAFQNDKNASILYLIPTPIGNLDDITKRALVVLSEVDLILCEDTRESSKLLSKYQISKRLLSCHEFNENKIKDYILDELRSGKNIGLVTDQGSPIISDPGSIVCKAVIENGFKVIALPGATAFVPALSVSGLNANHFLYYGFLNSKNSKQLQELQSLKKYPFTMIFYEAPHRLLKTLNNMLEIFGNRNISISREISKIYEETIRGKITEILDQLSFIKGEYVIVVEGCQKENYDDLAIMDHIKLYLDDGISEMEAIKKVSKERNVSKSIIYKEYIQEKKK